MKKLLKNQIPVANVCTIVTTTRSEKEKKKWEFFFPKKIHNFNLKFQQIKLIIPKFFLNFFPTIYLLKKCSKKLRNSSQKKN